MKLNDTVHTLVSIQESLQRMKRKLSGVTANVESLKKAAKLPEERNSGLVHSTPMAQSVSQPGSSEDTFTTRITWSERVDLNRRMNATIVVLKVN